MIQYHTEYWQTAESSSGSVIVILQSKHLMEKKKMVFSMGWKRLLVIIFFFPMVMTCQKMRHGKNMFTGAPRRASVSSVWSLWSTAECVEGKEQAVKGRAQEPPALMCSVG